MWFIERTTIMKANAVLLLILAMTSAVRGAPLAWSSPPPTNCPFEASKDFSGLLFTGQHAEYTHADTWYLSWGSDGNLYSPWTDGNVNGLESNSAGKNATTGFAKIIGDD